MRIVSVVVNWNGAEHLSACLSSLESQRLTSHAIVVVDNGSVDGSLELIERSFPAVKVIRNQQNLGYAHGNNQGIEWALEHGADAVLFVNNDATLLPDTCRLMVRALKADRGLGIFGPRILYSEDPDVIWSAGGMLTYRENVSTLVAHLQPDGPRWRTTFPVDYVAGCVMLVRSEVLLRTGDFDTGYFAYMEDLDYCVRATRLGFRCACVGQAAAYHDASASTGGGYGAVRKYMSGVNSVWFLRRHGLRRHWLRFVCYDVLSLPLVYLRALPRRRGGAVLAKGKGIFDGLRGVRVTAEVPGSGVRGLWRWKSPRNGTTVPAARAVAPGES